MSPPEPSGERRSEFDVPFNRPWVGDDEEEAVVAALRSGVLRGDGPVGRRVEERLAEALGVERVLLTTSCTHALEMAMLVLGVGPGDEVILPSFTFVSAANAVVLRGARPVFAEIREDTLNLDPGDVERRITERTKAVVPVHYGGVACRMDALQAVTAPRGVPVVEDAAQALGATYGDRPLGSLGAVGCFSFHDTKNVVSGEGGAFVTGDPELARAAEVVREKGTNRGAFLRGEVDRYTWIAPGSSYVVSDVLAALLEAQLDRREEIARRRRAVWEAYRDALSELEEEGAVRLPTVPDHARPNHHIFHFRVGSPELRSEVLDALRADGIEATFHYVPLHTSPFGRELAGGEPEPLPVTTRAAGTLVRLPLHPGLAGRAEEVAGRVRDVVARAVAPREGRS